MKLLILIVFSIISNHYFSRNLLSHSFVKEEKSKLEHSTNHLNSFSCSYFYYKSNLADTTSKEGKFSTHIKFKKKLDGGVYYAKVGTGLFFYYKESYGTLENYYLYYRIFDNNMNVIAGYDLNGNFLANSPVFKVSYGDNYFKFTIPKEMSGYFMMEISDRKKEKTYARFFISE